MQTQLPQKIWDETLLQLSKQSDVSQMAEVLGVVSSVLAIATVAVQLSISTYETIASFRSQRQDIQDVQSDLAALTVVLEHILKQGEATPDDQRFETLKVPLSCCEKILREIHESLAECTRHAKDHRDSVRTWLKLHYREKSFNEAKERLSSYKATLCVAFDTMNMYTCHLTPLASALLTLFRQAQQVTQNSLDEITKLIDRTREELEDQLDQVQERITAAEGSLRAILEAEHQQIQLCLKSLRESQTSREKNAKITITNNTATGANSRMIAGTDTAQPTFDLSVTHNRADAGASMAAGVHSSEVLKALLQQSSAPASVVSIVQSMQMGNFNPASSDVQELLQRQASPRTETTVASTRRIEEVHQSADGIAPASSMLEDHEYTHYS